MFPPVSIAITGVRLSSQGPGTKSDSFQPRLLTLGAIGVCHERWRWKLAQALIFSLILISEIGYQRFNHMKPLFLTTTLLLAATFTTMADGLDALQGRWTAKKSGENGPITQTLEFKKEKWTFKVAMQSGGGFVAE